MMIHKNKSLFVVFLENFALILILFQHSSVFIQAQRFPQDILRTPKQSASPAVQSTAATSGNTSPSPSLPIQLPPELAQLTPEQLQQLAQLRALQIQQQQQQQQQQQARHQQQQQPTRSLSTAASGSQSSTRSMPASSEFEGDSVSPPNDEARRDTSVSNDASSSTRNEGGASGSNEGATAPSFEVNWNKCPQLEPSESEKSKKTQVITKCLQSAPIPTNLTRENVEAHREQIATCALKDEGWFDAAGNYRYEKAELEIRSKKLEPQIEVQVLKFHVACREEAAKKFPREQNRLIDQVQFYQACMDYYISIACEIEVSVDSAR